MRRDISFNSKGVRCAGWLYVPDNLPAGKKAPTVVMAPGFSDTIDKPNFSQFAEKFKNSGLVTMAFDYRFLGRSEGEPRCQILWYDQIEDYRNAITWVSEQPEVDSNRIGIWGTSYSGRHVLWVAAYDKRVKAVVCQVTVPSSSWDDYLSLLGPDGFNKFLGVLNRDRIQRQKTGAVNYMPVVAPRGELAAIPDEAFYNWIMKHRKPGSRNEVTIESVEKFLEYDVSVPIQHISVPLLAVLAGNEKLGNIEMHKKLFEQAQGPVEINILPCGHFEVYDIERWFSRAGGAAVEWFKKYL